MIAMHSQGAVSYGLDIGGSKMELVAFTDGATAVDGGLVELLRERVATPGADFAQFIDCLCALVERADRQCGVRAPIGIGLPGIIDAASGRQYSSNVPALHGRLVVPELERALARQIAIGNDCQCFALSEAHFGAAQAAPVMFGAILGTGAGGGYCIDGRLQRGRNGIAGEWGHWAIPAAQLQQYELPLLNCPCGRRGCLERYVAGPGMTRLHQLLRARSGQPDGDGQGDQPLAIAARAAAGDAIAARTLAVHMDLLGHAFAQLVLILDPHVIVLGGGLSQLPHLYQQLPDAVGRHLVSGTRPPPIVPARFGDAGGARGAALLVHPLRHPCASIHASPAP